MGGGACYDAVVVELDGELVRQVQLLRAEGCSPKQIARRLGLAPARVVPLVRAAAAQTATTAAEPGLVGCWVSPGWSAGLTILDRPRWTDRSGCDPTTSGLVGIVVAREGAARRVVVCGYLVDTYCLGVKNVIGPRVMTRRELDRFVESFFSPFDGAPLPSPIDLARALIWGAIDYARGLGFEPAVDFDQTTGHLGPFDGPNPISFGRNGMPFYVQGPYDDIDAVVGTLNASTGTPNPHVARPRPTAAGLVAGTLGVTPTTLPGAPDPAERGAQPPAMTVVAASAAVACEH